MARICALIGPKALEAQLPAPPDLFLTNQAAWRCYSLVATQPITSPNGSVIFFSIPALVSLMDIYQVKNKRDCLDKVVYIWNLMHTPEGKSAPSSQG